jgi:hypothetical protein
MLYISFPKRVINQYYSDYKDFHYTHLPTKYLPNNIYIVTGLVTKFCDVWSPKHMTLHMTIISRTFKLLLHCCCLFKLTNWLKVIQCLTNIHTKLLLNKRPEERSSFVITYLEYPSTTLLRFLQLFWRSRSICLLDELSVLTLERGKMACVHLLAFVSLHTCPAWMPVILNKHECGQTWLDGLSALVFLMMTPCFSSMCRR